MLLSRIPKAGEFFWDRWVQPQPEQKKSIVQIRTFCFFNMKFEECAIAISIEIFDKREQKVENQKITTAHCCYLSILFSRIIPCTRGGRKKSENFPEKIHYFVRTALRVINIYIDCLREDEISVRSVGLHYTYTKRYKKKLRGCFP